jgi:S-adenosylmethionine synthetase
MILEAVAGKNPATHVGKIYNVLAREIAETLVAQERDIATAQCLLMGEIGAPIDKPALVHIKLATRDGIPLAQFKKQAEDITYAQLTRTSELVDEFIAGTIDIF